MNNELHIKETLPALSFNYAQLKAWAHGLTARYTNMVVTEDAITDVKRDMAELNKNKAKLETARKETVRRLSEPLRAFETQIKEISGIFDETYVQLGSQVKAFEDAQREEKRNTVLELIGQCFAEKFGPHGEWPEFNIPIQDKWLNKTTSIKAIREDIAAIIDRYMEEEARKSALEQARQDRAAAIENHVVSLNKLHWLNLPLSRFLGGTALSLDTPLAKVLLDIEERFKIEVDLRKAEENAKTSLATVPAEQKPTPTEQTAQKVEPQGVPAHTRAMSIVIEYDLANEAQVQACLENLKMLCAKFGARYR